MPLVSKFLTCFENFTLDGILFALRIFPLRDGNFVIVNNSSSANEDGICILFILINLFGLKSFFSRDLRVSSSSASLICDSLKVCAILDSP